MYESIWKEYVEVRSPLATLYHYCRHDAFCGIARTGKLWASDVLCMNDPDEITYAYQDVVAPIVAEMNESGGQGCYLDGVATPEVIKTVCATWRTHVACFSATDDLPSQWANYANGTGCSIGFDRRALGEWCSARNIALFPMSYELSLHRNIVRKFLLREKEIELHRLAGKQVSDAIVHEIRSHANKFLHSLVLSMKSARWRSEQEWRILVVQSSGHERFAPLRRPDGVCCFELPIFRAGIVSEIVLAPHHNSNPDELRRLLHDRGLTSVAIRPSACQSL